ncbi:hypothetical protein SAMN06295879_2331 [Agreia bicolorata]|uniref:Uncharacterized protein n=1 Tax=Agreia bicolorata TaxID=110935 RepID=A0A1T4Y7X1_9MICO|nr:hypothetical protein [Agreia bicolorata]SKA97391.1 hypothetical protein SAMN06295879_2331 [Agreia bicolorata]
MSDDQGILLFLGAGVVVLALIVVIGVASGRRKKKSGIASWRVTVDWIGDQPYLSSSDVVLNDAWQWKQFQERYPIGSPVDSIHVGDETRTLHISRVSQSLRAGWPLAKAGFTAYFEEYERSEFPVAFAVKADRGIAEVRLDDAGVTAVDTSGAVVFSGPWSTLLFSDGPDLILKNDTGMIHIADGQSGYNELEELVIKYGTLKQLHF